MHACDSAHAARQILAAVETGDSAGLASTLQRIPAPPENLPAASVERWDLLDAIAGQMRRMLRRKQRFDDTGVHLRLLRHLAGMPPAPASHLHCAL